MRATSSVSSNNRASHVWVRTDLVEAIVRNDGILPKGWRPRKRLREDRDAWGWCRAVVNEQRQQTHNTPAKATTTTTTSPFGHVQLRKTASPAWQRSPNNKNNNATTTGDNSATSTTTTPKTLAITLTVDDPELAPPNLDGVTVSFTYNTGDSSKVCAANTWWLLHDEEPPEDLTTLEQLHEPAVVFCLQRRYQKDQIYTYTGKILLALNPFRALESLYSPQVMAQYSNHQPYAGKRPPPHIYAIAEDAYQSMLRSMEAVGRNQQHHNQSILVSGESGAGKTVTTKIIMKYLATLSSLRSEQQEDDSIGIESQVLLSNPILESFGNARTVRNDNSSRFGKFIQILFAPSGCLLSASIQTYLLEKVRLISQGPGERNYHLFYELLAGLPVQERRKLYISTQTARDFKMTCQSSTFDRRDGVDDRETFQELNHALQTVGFTSTERTDLFSVACALLHTSNLTFTDISSTQYDASALDRSNASLRSAVALLGVEVEDLNNAMTRCAIQARGEVLYKHLDRERAQKALESLIKTTYGAMFEHIVRRVNTFIAGASDRSPSQAACIGVLDIFGFESFEVNSFEQLCINYCNEALQQQFNRFVFKLEQHEYQKEGIEWSFISFPDNQDVLDLIEKKHDGILSILDEQCRLPRCTDATFARTVYEKCQHPRLEATKAQQANSTFSIQHYAGLVEYDTANFLEKNKDELPKETTELLKSSSHPFLASLGQDLSGPEIEVLPVARRKAMHRLGSSLLRDSVGTQFRTQLTELRSRIEGTSPHYVRCLKPNEDLVPNSFNPLVIADQLNCAGVLEAIRVSRIGFPHRYSHNRFVERYSLLLPRRSRRDDCERLVESLTPQVQKVLQETPNQGVFLGMQMGKTKVFLRRRAFEALEHLRGKKLEDSAAKIQAMARMYICRIDFEIARYAAVVIQNFIRQIGAFRIMQEYRIEDAVQRIQRAWRCYAARRVLAAGLCIAWWCQSTYRGAIARQYCAYVFLDTKVSIIQRSWKRYRSKRTFRTIRRSVVAIQNRYRCRVAKRELYRLRREARDLDSVAAERDQLREESKRLRKELKQARQETPPKEAKSDDEVEKLKSELRMLRTELENARRRSAVPRSDENVLILMDELTRREEQLEHLRHEIVSLRSHNDSFSIKSFTMDSSSVSRGQISPLPVAPPSRSPVRSDVSLLDEIEYAEKAVENSLDHSFIPDMHASVPPVPFPEDPASLQQSDGDEVRYLHSAIRQGNRKLFDQILRQTNAPCVLVNLGDQYGRTAIHLASLALDSYMTEVLIAKAAAVNAQDLDGETPLHLSENVAMTELLLNTGNANPNIPNIDGICALHLAVQRRDSDSVRALLLKNANVNNADNIRWFTALHLIALPARTEGETSSVTDLGPHIAQLLTGPYGRDKPDLDYQDREGNAPLHYAVQLDTEEACGIICVFLEKGADPNIRNERNQSPLHLLCHNEELRNLDAFHEILHAILFHGGDPNIQSLTGCTSLHLSLYHKDIDSAVQLVSGGAELHLLWKKVSLPYSTELALCDFAAKYSRSTALNDNPLS
jgi:myosin-5